MEYGQLRALRELRDRGSIAAVASAFRVSAPAVSQQLAALQRSAGVALTRREGRRTVLTDAGLALADAADDVLSAMTVAQEAVRRYQDDATATVSVSALSSAAIAFFPALLATPPAGAPTLELTDFDVARADYALLTADIDLVIAHRLPGQPWPSTVQAIPLLEEPLDLAVRRGHPLDGDGPASVDDLRGAEWVHVHESFPLADSLRGLAGPSGGEELIRHRVNDWAITARLLAASNCVALMARHTGQAYIGENLVLRPLAPGLRVSRSIDILARPDTLRRAAARAVVDALQERARELTR